ncbi:hypothetical protein BE17_19335 [Sorangium cellulosum]|uniref:Uncharacterized protein n=1 Tax=Sorangium cellulosum TaxID=56 RepID=A0A150R423_SORCE|nr:hypothetical protein BE17_19335 [Sorangium cellulosum]
MRMRWPVIALGAVSSSAGVGCYPDWPTVAGIVTVAAGSEVLTLDTGGGGKQPVIATDEPIPGGCGFERGFLSMGVEHGEARFKHFDMLDEPENPHMTVQIAESTYQGVCPITIEVQRTDPYEADVSAGPCEVFRLYDGAVAVVESAAFHLTGCWTEDEYD